MWISKKMWNEMCDKVNKQQNTINGLVDCHNTSITLEHDDKTFFGYDIIEKYSHKEVMTSTDSVKDITLYELAKLVIDGTPIVRDVVVKKEYGKGEDKIGKD